MKIVRTVLALVVCVAMVGILSAAEGRKPGGRGPDGPREGRGFGDPTARIDFMVRGLELTDAQKATIEEIKKEFGPKLKAAQEKQDSILTEDQKKARAEVFQKARESNEGRQNMRETIEKALNLTDAQKKDMEAARKASEELNKALMDKVTSLLTPEQKEKLEKARQERGQRGDRGGNRKQ
jgi:Spy/CpxP family protein refolding chaperone